MRHLVPSIARVVILATIVAIVTVPAPTRAAASQYVVFPQVHALEHSRTYPIEGIRTKAGCQFADDELLLPVGWTAIERRDIAVDLESCRKIIEVGQPNESLPATDRASASGEAGTQSATFWKRGYHQVWFEDVANFLVISGETDIIWWYSGGCVTDGAGNGGIVGAGWSGWQYVSGNYSPSLTCARFVGTTNATAKNSVFCSPVTVWAYLSSIKATGYSNGTIGGSNSADVVNECLPLSKHERTVITAYGNGGP